MGDFSTNKYGQHEQYRARNDCDSSRIHQGHRVMLHKLTTYDWEYLYANRTGNCRSGSYIKKGH